MPALNTDGSPFSSTGLKKLTVAELANSFGAFVYRQDAWRDGADLFVEQASIDTAVVSQGLMTLRIETMSLYL